MQKDHSKQQFESIHRAEIGKNNARIYQTNPNIHAYLPGFLVAYA